MNCTEDELELDQEELDRRAWHAKQLRRLGVDPLEADMLADLGVDWHRVADLIEHGCPVATAVKIVLPEVG